MVSCVICVRETLGYFGVSRYLQWLLGPYLQDREIAYVMVRCRTEGEVSQRLVCGAWALTTWFTAYSFLRLKRADIFVTFHHLKFS